MSSRSFVAASLGAALLLSISTQAAEQSRYPSRPIRVVVPYTPGGITDVTTRMVTQELVKSFNQNVIVDNRPGANSIVGVDLVAKSSPDGYTLVSVIAAHAANQTLYPKLPYDAIRSFAPVSLLATAPLILCVTNSLPVKSVKELVELAKAKPGQLTFASSGIGAAAHLTTELLMLTTGTKMIHVPYKGTAPALLDLTGGQVTIMMDTPGSMLPHSRAGKIRALAMASEKRVAVAPELPTFIESGVQVVGGTWVGILAPAGTSRDIVNTLSREMQQVLKRQDLKDRFLQLGIDPVGGTPEEFTQFLKQEVAKWGKVIRAANVKVES
ncbi:MAG TPA: tripartite tricarboxylate transporter substrate binding protein [Burkholderiales bacterium]|jgi:tripartite-type tricarboxylate transporter receptor subunit TctC|nr:tripartite tricarboxylate transporter substrate binding protein [Burkholderiales bacterium]